MLHGVCFHPQRLETGDQGLPDDKFKAASMTTNDLLGRLWVRIPDYGHAQHMPPARRGEQRPSPHAERSKTNDKVQGLPDGEI